MPLYVLNTNETDIFKSHCEVHEYPCGHIGLINLHNKQELGTLSTRSSAMQKAKRLFPYKRIDGHKACMGNEHSI
jgi:hypothetical protein